MLTNPLFGILAGVLLAIIANLIAKSGVLQKAKIDDGVELRKEYQTNLREERDRNDKLEAKCEDLYAQLHDLRDELNTEKEKLRQANAMNYELSRKQMDVIGSVREVAVQAQALEAFKEEHQDALEAKFLPDT